MVDLNSLSQAARSAAMRGGTECWGTIGSSREHLRYAEKIEKRRGRPRICFCGCERPKTHRGMANGVCLVSGCELIIRRWVKDGVVSHGC